MKNIPNNLVSLGTGLKSLLFTSIATISVFTSSPDKVLASRAPVLENSTMPKMLVAKCGSDPENDIGLESANYDNLKLVMQDLPHYRSVLQDLYFIFIEPDIPPQQMIPGFPASVEEYLQNEYDAIRAPAEVQGDYTTIFWAKGETVYLQTGMKSRCPEGPVNLTKIVSDIRSLRELYKADPKEFENRVQGTFLDCYNYVGDGGCYLSDYRLKAIEMLFGPIVDNPELLPTERPKNYYPDRN